MKINNSDRVRRTAVLAGSALALAERDVRPAGVGRPPTCDGLPIDYQVPAGGALFVDPGGARAVSSKAPAVPI